MDSNEAVKIITELTFNYSEEKAKEVMDEIETMFPQQKRIELFV